MSYCVKITRLADNFEQVTGFGSLRGCVSEAKSIARHLRKMGEPVSEDGTDETWSGRRLVIQVLAANWKQIPKIEWTPQEFSPKRLNEVELAIT